ncbi:SusD family protein [Pedobacter steynii]|uniref:SusD family protein n=1 Tax=Pedobacter steynii TaxID=430522 RepID=A0A1G9P5S2_9SPHI|nr:RagB/SusD family nutrient uptake outer membrane protein [Pedobacter steynii]NQX39086.1 RagB/SusD family nutrient uptake outer membrane protein [Pedobacter steynii]SDL94079.1 SusD family protein [Pedobacter steynii]
MKRFDNVKVVFMIALSLTISSCKKSFLEKVPKGVLVATTYEDYDKLMNNTSYYIYNNAGPWQPAMLMGDEVSAEDANYNQEGMEQAGFFFQWEKNIFIANASSFQPLDNPGFLSRFLGELYTVNMIVNGVNGASGGSAQQKLDIQAQAKVTRAFIQFQLLNYFTKPYSAATASTDLGFPIIRTAEATATDFKRGTLQQSYDAIIDDISSSIPNLKIQPAFPTRMSKSAAEALLGKIYLFMGRNAEALKQFNDAFSDLSKMSNPPRLYDYNETFAANGSFLPISPVSGPNSPFNNSTDIIESLVAKMSYSGSYNGNGYSNDFLTISPQTVALYENSDWRLQFYTDLQADFNPIPVSGGNVRLRKYGLRFARIGMQLSELYLLRAEARARAGDLSGAKEDVEALRVKRMPAAQAVVPTLIAGNKEALIKFIIEERIREFAVEGYRWFDMRRLSVDPLFANQPAAKHIRYAADGTVFKEFTLTPARLTLKIPPPYLNAHPEMQDNP